MREVLFPDINQFQLANLVNHFETCQKRINRYCQFINILKIIICSVVSKFIKRKIQQIRYIKDISS